MDKNIASTNTKTNTSNQSTRVILTSQNSAPIKDLIADLSKQVMKKNKKLYRRLANK